MRFSYFRLYKTFSFWLFPLLFFISNCWFNKCLLPFVHPHDIAKGCAWSRDNWKSSTTATTTTTTTWQFKNEQTKQNRRRRPLRKRQPAISTSQALTTSDVAVFYTKKSSTSFFFFFFVYFNTISIRRNIFAHAFSSRETHTHLHLPPFSLWLYIYRGTEVLNNVDCGTGGPMECCEAARTTRQSKVSAE